MTNRQRRRNPPLVWILALSLVLVLGAAGCRHGGPRHRAHLDAPERVARLAEHLPELYAEIDATEEQRRVIGGHLDPLLEQASALAEDRDGLAQAYAAQWRSPAMAAEELNTLLAAEAETLVAFLRDATRAAAAVHEVLSPAQREKIAVHLEPRRRR